MNNVSPKRFCRANWIGNAFNCLFDLLRDESFRGRSITAIFPAKINVVEEIVQMIGIFSNRKIKARYKLSLDTDL